MAEKHHLSTFEQYFHRKRVDFVSPGEVVLLCAAVWVDGVGEQDDRAFGGRVKP